jgi:LmbE family N-acetylglucosaminyl deacetylase
MNRITRRNALKLTGISAGAALWGFPEPLMASEKKETLQKKLKIIVAGAHPDDPETICGGTMALCAAAGHEVISAYLTRGEAGIPGKSHEEAAKIRTEEALKACQILKARAVFLGQIDGSCEITPNRYTEIYEFLKTENPDLVFTHWPIDTHRDHRICSNLILDAWFHLGRKFDLLYAEAMTGTQSQNFTPTDYVDISSVIKQKHDACYIHRSQQMEEEYAMYHGRMEIFRGMEHQCQFAEAFVRLAQCRERSLPEV